MNVYTDDTISLSQNSAEKLLTTLLTDNNSLLLRDEFVSDVQQNITFLDDGSIVVDVPEIELVECENYEPVKTIVGTKTISICVKNAVALNTYYQGISMHNYNQNATNKKTKYAIKKITPHCTWQANTKQLGKVS